ncbi:MAG: phosphoribosylamine--glycine ligase [Methanomassiliicoccales archaeon]|nr:phosphoribosylamine--glycine ligase [Methanomassiliicoccales archaeon]
MRVLSVGGGGREHAIVMALAGGNTEIYAAMGNKNPGIARASRAFKLVKETDVENVVRFAVDSAVEMAVIGPEAPLEIGLVDALVKEGIGCVGPSKSAARIETSKAFMRGIMSKFKVPGNIEFGTFHEFEQAKKYILDSEDELAVKPIGLTGGKGVKIQGEHLRDKKEVIDYVREIFDNKIGGGGVVLEERLAGEEVTLQAFCDGRTVVPMPLVQDHKRAFDGDKGPNTGGMGSYSMEDHILPFMTKNEFERTMEIMKKMVEAMAKEGCAYVGILYGQFMLTKHGPKVIEFNARFGDPEAMNVLPLLRSNFAETCADIVSGKLSPSRVSFERKATVCKYVVPEGYGIRSRSGHEIKVDESGIRKEGAHVFYANVNEEHGKILTTSSRSIAVVGLEDTVDKAEEVCERGLKHITGEAIYVRHDVGKRELIQTRIDHMRMVRGAG